MSEQPTKGMARLCIHDDVVKYAPVPIEKPKAGEIRWGLMEVKELFDTFQSFLMLPQEYSIIGVYFDPFFQVWSVVVESEAILLPAPNEMIPTLMPSWQITNGKVRFVDMNIPECWQYYAGEKST